jgi:hypothetical protein
VNELYHGATMISQKFSKFIFLCFTCTPFLCFAQEAVTISNSGSTNFSGYQIVIEPTGQADITAYGKQSLNTVYHDGRYQVPVDKVKVLIDDLNSAMPLSQQPPRGDCMKSVSFGTSIALTYKGQRLQDIECLQNQKFYQDTQAILQAIQN